MGSHFRLTLAWSSHYSTTGTVREIIRTSPKALVYCFLCGFPFPSFFFCFFFSFFCFFLTWHSILLSCEARTYASKFTSCTPLVLLQLSPSWPHWPTWSQQDTRERERVQQKSLTAVQLLSLGFGLPLKATAFCPPPHPRKCKSSIILILQKLRMSGHMLNIYIYSSTILFLC